MRRLRRLGCACFAGSLLLPLTVEAQAQPGRELVEGHEGNSVSPRIIQPTQALLEHVKLPDGFRIQVFADGLGEPRMMAVGDDGTVYVTRRRPGDVLALRDEDHDGKADERRAVVRGLPHVHGIALKDGRMFLATVDAVYVAEIQQGDVGKPRKILDGLPRGGRHPNRTLAVGPDGMLYITVGSTCNCCVERSPESAAILRANVDGSGREVFATGLRNTLGIGWHPVSKAMYGMDNGSDWLGSNFPPEELNRLEAGKDYGWPFVYDKGETSDAIDYPKSFNASEYTARSAPSVLDYQAHTAPLQLVFYKGSQFPSEYRGDAFVAMHGSWNRRPAVGYEVIRIHFDQQGTPESIEPFLTGFLLSPNDHPKAFARPAGIAMATDGSLLVGSDATGVIYRIAYQAE